MKQSSFRKDITKLQSKREKREDNPGDTGEIYEAGTSNNAQTTE